MYCTMGPAMCDVYCAIHVDFNCHGNVRVKLFVHAPRKIVLVACFLAWTSVD